MKEEKIENQGNVFYHVSEDGRSMSISVEAENLLEIDVGMKALAHGLFAIAFGAGLTREDIEKILDNEDLSFVQNATQAH